MNYNTLAEARAYNALNILFESRFGRLEKLFQEHGSWVAARRLHQGGCDDEKEWQRLENEGVRLILRDDPAFPVILKEINSPPLAIYAKGNQELLSDDYFKIAIVGTRRASNFGLKTAGNLALDFASHNTVVVSGLALGIDQAAHKGCLEVGGKTIAVLAIGLDKVYPAQHQQLADRILDKGGLIVSEYPIGRPAFPNQFLERNRIISGLSRGTVIVEAPENSGALVTAACAIEQNREVFVLPGAVNDPLYRGSNNLIKQGAGLITGANDVLSVFNIDYKKKQQPLFQLNDEEKAVISAFSAGRGSLSVDKICQLTKLEPQKVNQIITSLVINGIIQDNDGSYFVL